MIQLENQNILIISNEPWGDIWYSKHNWAYELSKKNQVFFINPPNKWKISNLWETKITIENYTEKLKVLNYENILPLTRFELFYKVNNFLISKRIKKWLHTNNYKKYIYWTFDPYRFSNPQLLSPLRSIYFRVDKYRVKREEELLKNIDVVIVTAKELIKELNYEGPYLELSHGISDEEFKCSKNIEYKSGYFLYVGNIDYRMDVNLIERMLTEFPNETFLFIGKKKETSNPLFNKIFNEYIYNNIIIHGVEHFKELKNYIYYSKACLVPMDLTVHGNAVHHHKSLQYLAMGKPVISPIFNDVINNDQLILGYSNIDEAINRIKELDSSESDEIIKNRISFSQNFLYSNLIKKVEEFLN